MNNNIKHIKELLDKFMSAQTTEAEEQELSDYFANNKDIPTKANRNPRKAKRGI